MKLLVKSAIVHKNINLFKRIIQHHLHDGTIQFNAFINRKTGELLFEEEVHPGEGLNSNKWKPLCLNFRPPSAEGVNAGFEILEEQSNKTLFECVDLTPLARHILAQMIAALNTLVYETPNPDNVKEVLKEIIQAQLEAPNPKSLEKDIVHNAWHPVDRLEAERLLEHRAVGTYLFRKDEYVTILEEQLSSRWRVPVKCLTLTVLEPHDKVTDLTLVGKEGSWYIYDNDPSLEDTAFSDISALMQSIRDRLTEPLLFEGTA